MYESVKKIGSVSSDRLVPVAIAMSALITAVICLSLQPRSASDAAPAAVTSAAQQSLPSVTWIDPGTSPATIAPPSKESVSPIAAPPAKQESETTAPSPVAPPTPRAPVSPAPLGLHESTTHRATPAALPTDSDEDDAVASPRYSERAPVYRLPPPDPIASDEGYPPSTKESGPHRVYNTAAQNLNSVILASEAKACHSGGKTFTTGDGTIYINGNPASTRDIDLIEQALADCMPR